MMTAYIPFDNRVVAEEDGDTVRTAPGDAREVSAVSPVATHRPQPLDHDYPCTVCHGTARWDHQGIWRCVVCWPREAFARERGADGR